MFPDLERRRVEQLLSHFYARRILAHARDQVRLGHSIRGNSVTVFEYQRGFDDPSAWMKIPVAQFRFDPGTGLWSLYWQDRNRKWRVYEDAPPAKSLGTLLAEVDRDPTCIFWG